MRICLVSKEFAPFHGWGAGTYASLMARALADAGHDVHVLSRDAAMVTRGPRVRPGVTFHAVDSDHPLVRLPAFCGQPQQYSYAAYLALRELHKVHRFDAVEFPDFLGEAYFTLRAKRTLGEFDDTVIGLRLHMTIRHIRELNQEDWLDVDRAVTEHMEDWSIRHADVLMAPSHAMLALAEKRLGPLDRPDRPARAVHLPFPAQQAQELGATPRAEPARATVLYTGRFERRKGVHVLARACDQLWRDGLVFTLRMVGEDTLTGPLNTLMREHLLALVEPRFHERIVFEPRVERREMGPLFALSTLVVLPSLWENFPFACLEALACGTAFVGSDAGGMAEIIEPGVSGLLARGGSVASLAEQLRRGLADAGLRARIAQGAPRRVAELCDPSRIVAQAVELYARTASSRRGPATGFFPLTTRAGEIERAISPHHAHAFSAPATTPTPAVSVLIPVYNSHDDLDAAIASVRAQSAHDWEIIVIDDGSTRAETISALDALERDADGVKLRVVRVPHGGLARARNTGVEHARGAFVLPLDSDDMLDPRTIEHYLHAKRRNPGAAYITSFLRHFRGSPADASAGWIPLGGDRELLPVVNAGSHSSVLIERSLLRDVGGYDENLPAYEDWDLCCTLAERGYVGEVVPMFLIQYRLRPGSMMHAIDRVKHEMLRARLLAKHPNLSTNPGRTARFLLGDTLDIYAMGAAPTHAAEDPRVFKLASHLLHENVRYRVADRVNDALKRMGVQRAVKAAVKKIKG